MKRFSNISNRMILPKIYLDFCQRCSREMPTELVGTDFAGTSDSLKEYAIELLDENHLENFLTDNDFVFLVHQGYIFAYFLAEGNPDPDVYIFSDPGQAKNLGLLSEFLQAYK